MTSPFSSKFEKNFWRRTLVSERATFFVYSLKSIIVWLSRKVPGAYAWARTRVYAHAYTFYHGSSNTKTFGFASLVFELCSFSRFLLFCLLGVRALRCFIKTPCFLVLCLNFNTYTDYRKKKRGKSSTCSSKMTSLGLFFACLLFELSSVRANVVRRVGKCVLCVQYVCTV